MLILMLIFLPMLFAPLSWLLGRRSKSLRDRFVQAAGLMELALAFFAARSGGTAAVPALCVMGFAFEMDGFRQIYALIFAFMWAMTLLFSPYYFAHHHRRNRYYFFQLLTLGATMGVFMAGDLYTSFVFFEMMSFTTFVWVIQEETEEAIRAAKTYLAVAVIGGLVALMGLFLLWNRLGTLTLRELYPAAKAAGQQPLLYAAGGCILFGFGAKAGMFPLHIWLPKAHPVAPAPASALLSGALTKTGVWGILVLSCQLFRGDPAWGTLMTCFGAVTMLLGAMLALFSVDFKRTLACSSMSQIGFILTGVGMLGLLGEENALAARGVVLHMTNHSLFKLLLFLCAGVVFRSLHALNLNEIRGFGRKKPFLKLCFLVGALGIGGVPLFSGYISKTLLHESILEAAEQYGWALRLTEWIFLISGGLTLAYMTKLFVAVFVEKHPSRQGEYDAMGNYLSRPAALSLALAALPIPIFGILPGRTLDALAELGMDFLHGAALTHGLSYFSLENLKGAGISLVIGGGVYLLSVSPWMRKDGAYVERWPKKLDLEELVYRPLLLRLLPAVLGWSSTLFGENRITEPLARGSLRVLKTLSHACSDSTDALVLALRRTILRQSPQEAEGELTASAAYRLGAGLDRLSRRRRGPEERGLHFYRVWQTLLEAGRLIRSSLSFGLLMLALGICLVLGWLLLQIF